MPRQRKRDPAPGEVGHRWSPEVRAKIAAGMRAWFARMRPVATASPPPPPAPPVPNHVMASARRKRLARENRLKEGLPFGARFTCRLTGQTWEFTQDRRTGVCGTEQQK